MKRPTIKQALLIMLVLSIFIGVVISAIAYNKDSINDDEFQVTKFDQSLQPNQIVKEIHYTKCCMVQIDIVTKVGESDRNALFTYIEYNADGTIKTETVTEIPFEDIGKTATSYADYCREYHYNF